MQLTDAERRMLEGAEGRARRVSLEILAALGEIYGAERLIPIASAQVSGVSYANLGEAGLELIESWAEDGRVAAPATLNPAGMDLERWAEMGIPADFAEKQQRIVAAYRRMGIRPTCTCTPYLAGNRPGPGEHLAWSESSAVTFANSVLGARTNREGGPSALAAALCGRTPDYGLHRDDARRPQVAIRLEARLDSAADFGALGAAVGAAVADRVPRLEGLAGPIPEEHWMALSAALPTFGAAPIFHAAGLTPEAERWPRPADETVLGEPELRRAREALDDGESAVDLVFVGCPHATLETVRRVAEGVRGRRLRATLWVAAARPVREQAAAEGLDRAIEAAGGLLLADTCFVVAPLRGRFRSVVTDSAKGCFYARGPNGLKVRLAPLEACLEAAATGRRPEGGR